MEGCTPKDLLKVCNEYGTVVDIFIPNKKSKAGKRFAFVRFIKYAMGKVKDVNSIPNLRTLLMDEGFFDVKLKYLRGMWVMFEFDKVDTKMNMMQHIRVKSWFHVIQDAVHDFVSDERIVWVDIEGIPLNVWSRETFMRIGKKWGEILDIEDNVDSSFGRKRLCIKSKQPVSILESFKIIFKDESVHSPKKIPAHSSFSEEVSDDDCESEVKEVSETIFGDNSSFPNNNSDEMGKQHSKDPFKIYDILKKQIGGETREVGQAMGYTMDGYVKDFERIIGTQGADDEYVLTLIGRWNGETIILGDFNENDSFQEKIIGSQGYYTMLVKDKRMHRRLELQRKLHDINQMEAKDSFQKSKIKWAIEGDENSKFFHGMINKKRSQLAIRGVFDNGLWCIDPGKVKEAFFNHFEARFKKPVAHRFMLKFPFNKWLSDMQAADLERNVSRDEIRLPIWNYGENKSPDAKFVNDFRPISLIESVYKVLTKILANLLALVIADLVSDTQYAFVANRQILDGPFILNEILHWCKRKKKQAMFFKVDFAKAYDWIYWDYLLDVLEAFGFGQTWCKWIRGTFSSARALVLANGSPSNEFSFHCGLKQGDPLSPYLFILIMESLHMSFSRAVDEGLFKDVHLQGLTSISHLFYADDAMFIGEWSDANLKGVSSFHALNRALLLKWVWHFISQDGSLWFRVIEALYGPSIVSHPVNLSSNWCSIVRELHLLTDKELDKEVLVADKMKAVVGHSFRRPVRADFEHQQMVDLNSLLESVSLSQSHDRWFCDLTGDGEFRVKEGLMSFSDWQSWFSSIHLSSKVKNMLEGMLGIKLMNHDPWESPFITITWDTRKPLLMDQDNHYEVDVDQQIVRSGP
nr:RNA-directed DNA polymerase, eukaryota [Tanacetum cinerariifolium]